MKGQFLPIYPREDSLPTFFLHFRWDALQRTSGFFPHFEDWEPDIDCDASVFLLHDKSLLSTSDVVYFHHPIHASGGCRLISVLENTERFELDFSRLPSLCNRILFFGTIYHAKARKQDFSLIREASLSLVSLRGEELCRCSVQGGEKGSNMSSLLFGELFLHHGIWCFHSIGQGIRVRSIRELTGSIEKIVQPYLAQGA